MLLREVAYARPASLAEAVELLAANDGARALAGGQTLVNVMKARAGSPDALVDLSRIEELKGIDLAGDGTLEIGAMTTYTELVQSSEARARPILGAVCAQIADVQVRNRGTIGGNACSNDPTNHLPPLLCAVGAEMTIAPIVTVPSGAKSMPFSSSRPFKSTRTSGEAARAFMTLINVCPPAKARAPSYCPKRRTAS